MSDIWIPNPPPVEPGKKPYEPKKFDPKSEKEKRIHAALQELMYAVWGFDKSYQDRGYAAIKRLADDLLGEGYPEFWVHT